MINHCISGLTLQQWHVRNSFSVWQIPGIVNVFPISSHFHLCKMIFAYKVKYWAFRKE